MSQQRAKAAAEREQGLRGTPGTYQERDRRDREAGARHAAEKSWRSSIRNCVRRWTFQGQAHGEQKVLAKNAEEQIDPLWNE